MTPYTPWSTRSQFKAIEPRPIVVVRVQYQCEAGDHTGTDRASRLASSGRSRCLPGMKFVGAVRALLSLFTSPLVQACKQSSGGLTKRFGAFSVCVAHAEQHEWKGVGSDTQAVGEFRNVER